ncbi:MAG TPA: DinB family protein [Gemmatimonadaceae bacterium]|nr:DinB family protein [Gemmatimonadaceae bacterium]
MEIRSIGPFLDYWENVRGRTLRIIACIPREQLEWTYAPGKVTPGDVVRHLAAIERYMYAETVQNKPSSYRGCGRELADGHDAVMEYLERLHAESVAIFRELSEADLQSKCLTPAGTPITVWKWLRAMVEHEAHHRGQLYMMLSMLGVSTPPLYGLTEEEVRAKAVLQ